MKRSLSLLLVLLLVSPPALAAVLPPEGVSAGFLAYTGVEARRAVVLCESLSVCDAREGSVTGTLRYGDTFMTREDWDGWADCAYADGSKSGWVRSDYIAIDPAHYLTDGQTAVYAYGDTTAPRVALLGGGEKLPILAQQEGWYVVSLRGASGWIQKTPADTAASTWFKPEMLCTLAQADLVVNGQRRVLIDGEKLAQLSLLLCSVNDLGAPISGCPFDASLTLTLRESEQTRYPLSQVTLALATDSCCVYRVDGRDYQYARSLKTADSSPDNTLLFDLFD